MRVLFKIGSGLANANMMMYMTMRYDNMNIGASLVR
jgi:hypothetical protein